MRVCVQCRKTTGELCSSCGRTTLESPRNWSPPKRNNRRAWKRIANGEWLWDRRRVRRNPPSAIHSKSSWISLPSHKKGQRKIFQFNVPRSNGPDVDLGG